MPDHSIKQEQPPLINIAIFASGAGSNAQNIINHLKASDFLHVKLIVCNKPLANVLRIAATENIPSLLIERDNFFNGDGYLPELQKASIDFIVLAGFLWKIPLSIIKTYPNKIINIHPALLPKYGGKNMYGNKVHEAVVSSGDKESGITIHYVDEEYDNGDIIFQTKCTIDDGENPETLAKKIHQLEYKNYPLIIEGVIRNTFEITKL
jgi:phosphoribosylglycinamide formyltransferase-1